MSELEIPEERRRYYRLLPSIDPTPHVTFCLDEGEFDVKVVNLSPGGLLCYIHKDLPVCRVGYRIPEIQVKLPDKKPVTYAGQVIRIQPTQAADRKFCAIEFVQFDQKVLQKGSKPLKPFRAGVDEERFLARLGAVDSFLKARSLEEELRRRKQLYDQFSEEALRLPLEERWYFYEVLEEMKRQEPNYSPGLLREFTRLCRGEDRSEFVPVSTAKEPIWRRIVDFWWRHIQRPKTQETLSAVS